jgi:NAD(P)-dependent dehydrogenase (short-subunit alcohol dehydrogenase family)
MNGRTIAVVTGANRGIGREVARQLAVHHGRHVVVAARDAAGGEAAAEAIRREGGSAEFRRLDVADEASVREFARGLADRAAVLEILVNNAGILPDEDAGSVFSARLETIERTLRTNTFGPFLLMRELVPLMRRGGRGRVVNLSSGMGQLAEMNGGYPAYRLSKTALNALTRIFADETEGENILVNSVCPGWVRTEMGGEGADRSVEQGADTVVWLATLPDGGPTGGFFRDREPIAW